MNVFKFFHIQVGLFACFSLIFCDLGAQAELSARSLRAIAAVAKPGSRKNTAVSKSLGLQEPQTNVGPIDELRETLYRSTRSRRVLAQLRAASEALRAQKFELARRAATAVKNDAEFGDHARWILAEALLFQAQADLGTQHFDSARQEAKDAVSALAMIPADYPYSPLSKWLPRAVGRADLIRGRVACQAKKWVDCRKQYESGLERLASSDALVYVRPEDVEAYAEACSHRGPELCSIWLGRLALIHPRNTLEYKALLRKVPDFLEHLPHGAVSGRITVPYHLPDPDTGAFDDAMGKYLDHKDKDAIQGFRRFLDEFPRSSSRFRAKYWLAQAMVHDKKDNDARKLLLELQQSAPLTYYGLLAAVATGNDLEAQIRDVAPDAQDYDPMLQPLDLVRLRRAQALVSQKAYDPAALELRDMKAHEGLSNAFLIYLAMLQSEAGAHSSAFPVLSELINRGDQSLYTQFGLKVVFPLARLSEIQERAKEYDLDPILVLSLMKQESAFDPGAMSNTGALGLMQLMPATASDIATDLSRAELVAPDANMRTGMKYLSQLMRRYNGNIVYALAAYNAGPGSVNRWIKASTQNHDMLEFIENITFKETREYVSSIIRNYFWYARRLQGDAGKSLRLVHFWSEVTSISAATTPIPEKAPTPTPSSSTTPSASPTLQLSPSLSPSLSQSPTPTTSLTPETDDIFGPGAPPTAPMAPHEDEIQEYGPGKSMPPVSDPSPMPRVSGAPDTAPLGV